jgi:hypothetical protein
VSEFEKLGAFYLGRVFDREADAPTGELLLYESKDLTTHAVCVGMTGSGKTGLCVTLLEEAAIDGIPALAIDPKGDLGNLLLTFPELRPRDFLPWVDPAEAGRKGLTPEQYAGRTAETWRKGLASWGQDPSRIARFRDAVDLAIYTPGSTSGRPLRVLRSLDPPAPELLDDVDALRDRVGAIVSGLLSLLGVEADPIRSREHILLSSLIERAWREGRGLDLASLIAEVQSPPFARIGVMDLESFFPEKGRFEFAMGLNGLLASPGFSAWMEGEPLDVGRLLYTAQGRPRLSILSIAHLSDPERMFFVTLLLNEVISWMRSQPGTSSLRALLYMDEVFGYFPPTANPPAKKPMLTLLKQARAYGLGVVLATQNPVDLDYKGLSNTGTWFLGRLQTERDKLRVLDGLEGVSAAAGAAFDRQELERTLSGLKSRVFLMNNVHDDRPELFHTRWALSYLRGPLTREQIRTLCATASPQPEPEPEAPPAQTAARVAAEAVAERGVPPPDVPEYFAARRTAASAGGDLVYRPALLGTARLRYADRRSKVDLWQTARLLAPLQEGESGDPWGDASTLDEPLRLDESSEPGARFSALPAAALRAKSYRSWAKGLSQFLYRESPLRLCHSATFKVYSEPGRDEGEFRVALSQLARERRDLAVEKLRSRYAPKLARLQERIRVAQERVERESSAQRHHKVQTAISLGATVLGALFGRKVGAGTIGKATTTARSASRAASRQRTLERAADRVEELQEQLEELQAEFDEKAAEVAVPVDPASLDVEEYLIRPRKSDIQLEPVVLVWTPWSVSPEGIAEPLF